MTRFPKKQSSLNSTGFKKTFTSGFSGSFNLRMSGKSKSPQKQNKLLKVQKSNSKEKDEDSSSSSSSDITI